MLKKEIKEKYLNKLKKTQKKYKGDNEAIHSICDGILLELLKELEMKEVAELFEVISDETPFWYS